MEALWTFKDNETIETDKVDLKPFKATGKFFDDVQTLAKLFNVRVHPALRESSYRHDQADSDEPTREVTALSFMKHRLDRNSLRTMFICLPPAQNIQTLK